MLMLKLLVNYLQEMVKQNQNKMSQRIELNVIYRDRGRYRYKDTDLYVN